MQRERLEHLLSDRSLLRQKGSTYHQRAVAEAVEERGGRFAALSQASDCGLWPRHVSRPTAFVALGE